MIFLLVPYSTKLLASLSRDSKICNGDKCCACELNKFSPEIFWFTDYFSRAIYPASQRSNYEDPFASLIRPSVYTKTSTCTLLRVPFSDSSGLRFKLLFSMCDDKDSRKRTTRASILAANRAASSSSESEEVGPAIISSYSLPVGWIVTLYNTRGELFNKCHVCWSRNHHFQQPVCWNGLSRSSMQAAKKFVLLLVETPYMSNVKSNSSLW